MDTTLPTGNRGRLLALAVTGCLLLLLWLAVVSPLIDFYVERADRIRRDATVLEHMTRLAASLPQLRERAHSMRESDEESVFTIEGGSDAVAAANLQSTLQEMATVDGANVTSFENVPAQTVGGYRRIGLKLSLHVPWTVLVNLLKSIEDAHPPMLIDDLEIHALPQLNLSGGLKLEAEFTVYAFRNATTGGDER
jgi:hypothetical protein